MLKRILNSLLVLGLLSSSILATITPVSAADPKKADLLSVKTEQPELLNYGEKRITPSIKTKLVKADLDPKTGKTIQTYTATISSLPETLKDLKTKITCEWLYSRSQDGRTYFQTGNNLYQAKITGTRITVDYEGRETAWDPAVWVGGLQLSLTSGPTVIPDPLNPNYPANTIKWVYSGQPNILSDTIVITRYARQIEGALLEYFVLDKDPGAQVLIKQNTKTEAGFVGQKPVEAWDADGRLVKVSGVNTSKIIAAADLAKAKYPVTIDPTTAFLTSASDGYIDSYSTVWATAYPGISSSPSSTSPNLAGGVFIYGGYYYIWHEFFFFDTSTIGTGSTITAATFQLFKSTSGTTGTGTIMLQSGMPNFPHDPLVAGDFGPANYSGNLGSMSLASWATGYNSITLTASGLAAINKTGTTKLTLRQYENDILNVQPSVNGHFNAYAYEQGTGYQPKLTVTYTVTIVTPTVTTTYATGTTETSSTLGGTLTADGGASCSTRVEYGTSTGSYTSATSWVAGYTTGQTWSPTVYGLSKGTVYYYRANATNSAGQGNGAEKTFLTQPGVPTGFSSTPGDTQNVLNWTKGTGSTKTMVRFKTTGYPTSITDGTQVYFNTLSTTTHTSLTNGTTYYYSAWAEAEGGTYTTYSPTYATCSGIPTYTGPPTMTTNSASAVTMTTATLNGNLDALNNGSPVIASFQYSTDMGYGSSSTTTSMTATGPYSKGITGLTPGTLYHFRAKGVNANGTSYGADATFTTSAVTPPTMTTTAATGVTETGATMNGTVTANNGASVTVWFQYGLTTGYGSSTSTSAGLVTGNTFFYALTSLPPSTLYHFRAVGQNSAGITYGSDLTFTTSAQSTPSVVTNSATAVGVSTATLHGTLNSLGTATPVTVSFQYSTDMSYGSATSTSDVTATGPYSKDIATLAAATLYHFRAKATNANGTTYGADQTFTTGAISAPTMTTNAPATTITETAATLHGTVTAWGSEAVTGYFQYGLDISYGSNSSTTGSLGNGATYAATLTYLLPNTTYHYRAAGVNSGGTGYGADSTFTTLAYNPPVMSTYSATLVSWTTVTLNGNLDSLGSGSYATVNFQYGTTASYGTESSTSVMAAIGTYSSAVTGLTANTLYHFRAKGVNVYGTSYGLDGTFTTSAIYAPTITSVAATGVTRTEATLHGTVTAYGGMSNTVWFQYGLTSSYGSTSSTVSGLGTGDTFYFSLSSLTPGSTYHFRAVGQNSGGTGYGDDMTLATTSPSTPTVATSDATGVGATAATLLGALTDDGGVSCSIFFEWDTDAPGAPYANTTGLQPGYTSSQTFTQFLSGLTAGTIVYYRAGATNSGGTGYGGEKYFTCLFGPPSGLGATPTSTTSITLAWTSIGDQTAIFAKSGSFPVDRLDGDQIYMGTAQTTSYGGLLPGTSYFFRAWSWKTGGTWSDAYAEDAATTPASTTAVTPTLPDVIGTTTITAPTTWWTEPNTTFVAALPIYPMTQYIATGTGIPIATIWSWIGVGIVLLTIAAFSITRSPMMIAGAGLMAVSACSLMGFFPMLVLGAAILIGIPVLWMMKGS